MLLAFEIQIGARRQKTIDLFEYMKIMENGCSKIQRQREMR